MTMIDPNILNEQDLRLLKAYLDNEEKLKAFIATYMYIIAPGMGDGIMESQLIESEEYTTMLKENNIDDTLNEGILGNVLAFFKGKGLISKYYKGLEGAAKNYISKAKGIEKIDQDKKAGVRKAALDGYNAQVKSLGEVKSKLEELKKESKILSKYDQFANNKYKIKMVLSGRKAGVSMSKMSGYEDDLNKIKADQKDLNADIKAADDAAKKEKEEKDKAEKEGSDEKVETPEEKKDSVDSKLDSKIKGAEDKVAGEKKSKENAEKVIAIDKKRDELKAPKKRLENLAKRKDITSEQSLELMKLQKEMRELSKEKESLQESTIPLSHFIKLTRLNNAILCLENSVGEKL